MSTGIGLRRAARNGAARPALALVPALLTLILYAPSLRNPLVWDDDLHVPRMRAATAASALVREPGGYRRPFVLLSYRAQSLAGADNEAALHGVNVALHALNGTLLFWLLARMGVASPAALLGAVLFVAHPLQWAAVAYVSGRTDVIAAFFTLLALHLALTTARRGATAAATAAGASLAVVCAALSKESGVLAGPLATGLWWTELSVAGRARTASRAATTNLGARPALPVLAAAALLTVLLAWFVVPPALSAGAEVAPAVRLRAVGAAALAYARLLVAPSGLHLDRLTEVDGADDLAAGALVIALLVAAAAVWIVRPTRLRFGFAALALLALPALNVVPIYPAIADHWVFTGEQLAYLPLLALAPLAASAFVALLTKLLGRRLVTDFAAAAAGMALVLVWSRSVHAAQRVMHDPEAVYRNTLEHSPSPRACFNLGVAVLARGDYEEAVSAYQRCAGISPSDAKVWVQLGVAYQRLRERNKAELAYAKAVELDPRDPYAWSNYASLDASFGDYAEARRKWEKALALDSGFAPAREGLEKLKLVDEQQRGLPPPA